MKKSLIRLEDVGPGGRYATEENLLKLRAISDFLLSEGVPFHVSVIPRYINLSIGYDKSIADINDRFVQSFNNTLNYLCDNGASLGMHGYTHQYDQSISAQGIEFHYSQCKENCPPEDQPEACQDRVAFDHSYASSRIRQGFDAFKQSGLKLEWGFSPPHYRASLNQRCILESWVGCFFENDPLSYSKRSITIRDTDTPLYRGIIYVPTPLEYVEITDPDSDVERICHEIQDYTSRDLASFFFHPYLEFPYIHINETGGKTTISYDDNSHLKRLIKCFKEHDFTFVHLLSLINFIPSMRQTELFPVMDHVVLTGDVDGDKKTEFIVWKPLCGSWSIIKATEEQYLNRQSGMFTTNPTMKNWAKGNHLRPFIGDFNGDGKADIVVWNPGTGDWQVALSDGITFADTGSWLRSWAVGDDWVPLIGDFNGDGKADIMVYHQETGDWQVALSNGSQFIESGTWLKPWAVGNSYAARIGDFNGDGKADIVVWNPEKGDWQIALSDGARFIPDGIWLNPWAIGAEWQSLIGDFDGDGMDDVLVVDVSRGDWQIVRSDGNRFIPLGNAFRYWAADPNMEPMAGYFHVEGRLDICARFPHLRNGTIDIATNVIRLGRK